MNEFDQVSMYIDFNVLGWARVGNGQLRVTLATIYPTGGRNVKTITEQLGDVLLGEGEVWDEDPQEVCFVLRRDGGGMGPLVLFNLSSGRDETDVLRNTQFYRRLKEVLAVGVRLF